MNKNYKSILASIIAVAFTAESAMAAEGFSGLSIGIIGNDSTFDSTGSEFVPNGEVHSTSHSVSETFPSFFIEYTGGTAGGMSVTLGIEHIPGEASLGVKTRTDDQTGANAPLATDDDGTYSAKAEISNHTAVYVEPGYMFNDYIGLYGKGGVTHVEMRTLESIAIGDDSSTYGNEDVIGVMYGAGIKAVSPWGIFIKLEALRIDYENISLVSTSGNLNEIEAETVQESVRLAIGYNF